MTISEEDPDFVKIRQKYQVPYMKTEVCFIVPSNIKLPYKNSLQVKWYQVVEITKEV